MKYKRVLDEENLLAKNLEKVEWKIRVLQREERKKEHFKYEERGET